jgi:hypothetical protein
MCYTRTHTLAQMHVGTDCAELGVKLERTKAWTQSSKIIQNGMILPLSTLQHLTPTQVFHFQFPTLITSYNMTDLLFLLLVYELVVGEGC